jgi:hypothetical protein
MFGREVNTPAILMFPQSIGRPKDEERYLAEFTRMIQEAHAIARSVLGTSAKRMKRTYDLRVPERAYKVGDAVYLLDSATVKGKCKKLQSPWKVRPGGDY